VVVELPVKDLGTRLSGCACRFCTSEYKPFDLEYDPFKELAHAMAVFERLQDNVKIEFVVPEPEA
jgi:hypothetical protein